jgi:vacuolar-type H+-ATPase subunit E/Vma4
MGLDELLRVLREEAANEARSLREGADREAERVISGANAAVAGLRDVGLAREEEARTARLRACRDAAGLDRERALLVESRRQLDELFTEALARLPALLEDADVERFAGELLREARPVSAVLVVDPGSAPAAGRAVVAAGSPAGLEVREAAAARGGVELITGSLVLDDTLASRLERAWGKAEPEIAGILFSER